MIQFRLNIYQKKQIDIAKEEKLAHDKEMKIHEDKMHKLNLQMKELEVIPRRLIKFIFPFSFFFRILIKNVV